MPTLVFDDELPVNEQSTRKRLVFDDELSTNKQGTAVSRGIANLGRGVERGFDKAATGLIQVGVDAFGSDKAKQYFEQQATKLNQQGEQDNSILASIGDVFGQAAPSIIGGGLVAKSGLNLAANAPRISSALQSLSPFAQRVVGGAVSGIASGAGFAATEARQAGETRMDKIPEYAAYGAVGGAAVPVLVSAGKKALPSITKAVKGTPKAINQLYNDPMQAIGSGLSGVSNKVGNVKEGLIGGISDKLLLTKSQRALPKSQRLFLQSLKQAGIGEEQIATAFERQAAARAKGLDLPLYEAFDSNLLKGIAKNIVQGSASKEANAALETIRGKIPTAITKLANNKDPAKAGQDIIDASQEILTLAENKLRTRAAPIYKNVLAKENRLAQPTIVQEKILDPFRGAKTINRTIYETPEIIKDPTISKLIKQVRSNPLWHTDIEGAPIDITGYSDDSMQVLQLVKRKLDDSIGAAVSGGARQEAAQFSAIKNKLVSEMDKRFPSYVKARSIYADDITDKIKLEESPLGVFINLQKDLSENTIDKLLSLNPVQIGEIKKQMYRIGKKDLFENAAQSTIQKLYNKTNDNALMTFANKVEGSPDKRKTLRALVGKNKAAEIDGFFKDYKRVIRALRLEGSDTAQRLAAQNALNANEAETVSNTLRGTFNAIKSPATTAAEYLLNNRIEDVLEDPKTAMDLQRFFFTRDGERLLKKLQKQGDLKGKSVTMQQILQGAAVVGGGAVIAK